MWAVLTPKTAGYRHDRVLCFKVSRITAKTIFAKAHWGENRYPKNGYRADLFDDETSARRHRLELRQELGVISREDAIEEWSRLQARSFELITDYGQRPANRPMPERYNAKEDA